MINKDHQKKDLLVVNPNGLYCEVGDFYIDPWKAVPQALITHAHGDHCYRGMGSYLAHHHTSEIMTLRYGFATEDNVRSCSYGEMFDINGVQVSYHPAGHILGSAQIRLEYQGEVWLVSGDYKRDPDPTAQSFEVVKADVMITEATFGLPIFKWQPTPIVAGEIVDWWSKQASRIKPCLLYAYSLGKAQRVLAELRKIGQLTELPGPIILHPSCVDITKYYQSQLPVDLDFVTADDPQECQDWKKALIIAPPTSQGGRWVKRLGQASTAFASGWMTMRGARRRRSMDQGFIISDHSDWEALIRTCQQSQASKILVTHGYNDILSRYLQEEMGIESQNLKANYQGEVD